MSVSITGGQPPYVLSNGFIVTYQAAGTYGLVPYVPETLTTTVTDAVGTQVTFTTTTTGTLSPVLSLIDPNWIYNGVTYNNITYTTDLGQAAQHAKIDVGNGFRVYMAQPPSHTHAIYSCDDGPPRSFISTDPGCEGHPTLGLIGWLYDAADSAPGFTAPDLYRTFNPTSGLHRVQSSSFPLQDGFQFEARLGFLPPRVPIAWCGIYVTCSGS